MINLIIVLISISLFGVMLLAGLNSINTSIIKEKNYISEIELATTSAVNIVDGYRLANGIQLPNENWKDVIKDYGKMPKLSFDSKWKYKKGTDSYICLVAKNTKAVSNAFEKLSGDNSFYELGNKCETSAGSDKVSISTKL